jgi:hypothetical protein
VKITTIKDKHLKLDQKKIDIAKKILDAKTETETIEMALSLLIQNSYAEKKKKDVVKRILARRARIRTLPENVTGRIRKGRSERDKLYE